jgi:hypothetical protein
MTLNFDGAAKFTMRYCSLEEIFSAKFAYKNELLPTKLSSSSVSALNNRGISFSYKLTN